MPVYREIGTEAPDYEPMPYYSSDTEGLLEYLTSAHEGQSGGVEEISWLQTSSPDPEIAAALDAAVADITAAAEAVAEGEEPGETAAGV